MKVGAIVLAAGLSRRFGHKNKLLTQVGKESMISKVVGAIARSEASEVIVITGHEAESVGMALSAYDNIQLIHNADYRLGMSTSIKKGIQHISEVEACMICLGDLPYLTTEDYNRLIQSFQELGSQDCIMIPSFRGRKGHPVIFGRRFFPDLGNLLASDEGAREIVSKNQDVVMEVELGTESIFLDIDFKTSLNSDRHDS